MLSFFIVCVVYWILFPLDADVISPTVVNATGEYYIADEYYEFDDKSIKCNSTLNDNCFILCLDIGACSRLKVECSSKTCNIDCYEDAACINMKVTIASQQQNVSTLDTNFSINCNAIQACTYIRITHSKTSNNINVNLSMVCHGEEACARLHSYLLENDTMHLICNGSNIDGTETCFASNITISRLTNHTKITCSGIYGSDDCVFLYINVPATYQPDFITFEFLNGPYGSSADNIWLQCIDGPCNTSTGYPILGVAEPSVVNETGIYYLTGPTNGYSIQYTYRWQSIICNNSSQKCFIQCGTVDSCQFTSIECNDCDISCTDRYSCSNSVIMLYGEKANIMCNFINSCSFTHITTSFNTSISLTCFGDIVNSSVHPSDVAACEGTQLYCNSPKKDSCIIQSMLYDPSPLLEIHIPSQFENGFFNLSYIGQQQIYKVQIYCQHGDNLLIWNATNGDHHLQEIGPCNLWKPTFLCDNDTDCTIDCNQNITNINPYYSSPIGCSGMIIDGSTANNLNISCNNYSCSYTKIYCSDKSCNIKCDGVQSCSYTTIQATESKLVSIIAETQTNDTHSAAIYKSSIYVNFTDKLYIDCKNGYCLNNQIYADHADNVSIQCANNRDSIIIDETQTGCNDTYFHLQNASHIQFYCDGELSCIDGAIFAQNSHLLNITFSSNSNNNNNTCSLPLIYGSKHTLLNCENYGCQYLDLYLIDGLSDVNVTWDGDCSCNSLDLCMDNGWNIYCGINYNNYSLFHDNACNNNVCCNNITINNVERSFGDYWNDVCKKKDDKHKLIKVAAVSSAIVIIIGIGIGLFVRRYRQKRKDKEEKYLQINS